MDDAIYVIDRIEEGIAVLVRDSGEKTEVSLSDLPSGAHEVRACAPASTDSPSMKGRKSRANAESSVSSTRSSLTS